MKSLLFVFTLLYSSCICNAQEFSAFIGAVKSQNHTENQEHNFFIGRDPATGLPILEDANRTLQYKVKLGWTVGINMDWDITERMTFNTGIEVSKENHIIKDESDSSPMDNERNRGTFFPELDSTVMFGYGKNIFYRETDIFFIQAPFRARFKITPHFSALFGCNIETPLFHKVKFNYWEVQTESDIGYIDSSINLGTTDKILNELLFSPNLGLSARTEKIGATIEISKTMSDIFNHSVETRPLQINFKILYFFKIKNPKNFTF